MSFKKSKVESIKKVPLFFAFFQFIDPKIDFESFVEPKRFILR